MALIKVFHPKDNHDLNKRNEFSRTKEHLAFFFQELPEFEYLVYSDVDVLFDFHYTNSEDELVESNIVCVFYKENTEDILMVLTNDDDGGIEIKNTGYLSIKLNDTLPIGDHYYILYYYEDNEDIVNIIDRNNISIDGKLI